MTDTPEPGDAELKTLAQSLTEQHKHDLDRIYHVVQDKLEGQNKILKSIMGSCYPITCQIQRCICYCTLRTWKLKLNK